MSLTSIIRDRADIRDGLHTRVARPQIRFEAIKAPPLTANYGVVGTAFDYLLRFHLERTNSVSQTSGWVAEMGVDLIGGAHFSYDLDRGRLDRKADRRRQTAEGYLEEAKRAHLAYLGNGILDDALLIAALRLAYLDVAFRVGPDRLDWKGLEAPDSRDVADLHALLGLVEASAFRAKRVCLLNPTFGEASRLVGGADADILLDDCLIDVKNTKDPDLDTRDFFQLIGYFLLCGYAGVACGRTRPAAHEVNFLAIYFSRYGFLWRFPVDEVLPPQSIPETARWFFDSVCRSKAVRARCFRLFAGPFAKHLTAVGSKTAGKSKKRKNRAA